MAQDPMPASQANTMLRISRVAVAVAAAVPPPVSALATEVFLPFIASIERGGGGQVALVLGLVGLQDDRGDDEVDRGAAR